MHQLVRDKGSNLVMLGGKGRISHVAIILEKSGGANCVKVC